VKNLKSFPSHKAHSIRRSWYPFL